MQRPPPHRQQRPTHPPLRRDCVRLQDRYATGNGHWALLEPRIPLPVKIVPDGQRLFIAGDGRAIKSGTGLPPDPNRRIRRALVCPARPRPCSLPPVRS
ncbi:DUF6083 domain-containing protein [Streptomyces coffeae]|uniref:DUF6083 domain-containing protein n=1 Tax=Streptomyces coffeae TaxID=621382 RepID=UPI00355859A4